MAGSWWYTHLKVLKKDMLCLCVLCVLCVWCAFVSGVFSRHLLVSLMLEICFQFSVRVCVERESESGFVSSTASVTFGVLVLGLREGSNEDDSVRW